MRPYPHSTSSEDSATRADQRPDRPAIDADDDKSALRTTPKLTSLSSRRRKIVDLVPKKEVIDDDILLRNPGSGSFNTALKVNHFRLYPGLSNEHDQSDDEKDTKDRVKGKEKKDDKKDPDKTEGPVLDAAAVERRLRLCDAHDLPLDFRHGLHGRTVSRLLLSSVYGGSTQSTVCDIAKRTQDRLGHNISRIVCPNVVWNPYVPREPLKAGLACSIKSSDATWLEPFPLVVGLGINSWLYMGHYLGIKALPLSIKEFDNQSEKVLVTQYKSLLTTADYHIPLQTKQEWYTSIASKRWAENTRKKISFTKRFGRRPRAEELVDYKGPNPSMNEIIDAFGTGDEVNLAYSSFRDMALNNFMDSAWESFV
ncbi:hypothetical protein FRB99_000867 [Tulasnella sp. 403]|nr:hypothetical protein FRB99_000867 [Tulasnella sp. 403]